MRWQCHFFFNQYLKCLGAEGCRRRRRVMEHIIEYLCSTVPSKTIRSFLMIYHHMVEVEVYFYSMIKKNIFLNLKFWCKTQQTILNFHFHQYKSSLNKTQHIKISDLVPENKMSERQMQCSDATSVQWWRLTTPIRHQQLQPLHQTIALLYVNAIICGLINSD